MQNSVVEKIETTAAYDSSDSSSASSSSVSGVTLADERFIPADAIIDATGVFAGALASVTLPFVAVRSHYFNCYHPNEALFPHDMPGVLIPHVGAYFRGSRGGNFLLGVQEKISKTLANDEFRHLDYETLSDLVNGMDDGSEQLIERYEQISELVPEFDEARIVSHHSGLSTYTPDGNYVIGEGKPNLKGYFVASGCCGSGVSSAGGVGEFVANMVCGETSHLAKKFDPARFGKTDFQGEEFKSMCVAARSSKLGKIIN